MKFKMILLISVLVLPIIAFYICSLTKYEFTNFKIEGDAYVVRYEGGVPFGTKRTTIDDIKTLLKIINEKNVWKLDINTYAPNILVRAKNFNLNINDSRTAVLNFTLDGKNWRQVSRRLTEAEYMMLANF